MMAWTSLRFRLLVLAVVSFLSAATLWPAGSASGQPLFQGSLACPAGVPTGEQVGQGLLNTLISAPTSPPSSPLNSGWETAEPSIEGKTFNLNRVHIPDGCNGDLDNFCRVNAGVAFSCSFVYVDMTMDSLQGLGGLRFTNLAVPQEGVNHRNVAAHTDRGPDASVITDGVLAREGSSATDPAYAIVLPHNGADGAIVIDLGTSSAICGVASTCTAPTIQADNDDVYQLDYLDETTNTWTQFAQFPKASSSGLRTRPLSSSKLPSSFTARYVRVFGVSGGNTWAVSELKLWNTANTLISVGKAAVGPLPTQVFDGQVAPSTGWSATDAAYSVVLTHKTGAATALSIDLGRVVHICGNNAACGHPPRIEADNDDTYMIDYSVDGKNWTTYGYMNAAGAWNGTFPSVGGSGLHQRDMACVVSSDPDDLTNPRYLSSPCAAANTGFSVQYLRVYARSGGDTFAVSEVMLWDTAGNPVPATQKAYGPEPFLINGEFAPEGTAWDDTHYVTKLGDCTQNPSCPFAAAKSAVKRIDLTAVFPVTGITIQADNNDTYQVDGSPDGLTWTLLWVVPTVSSSNLRTRSVTIAPPSQPCSSSPTPPTCVRYVRVYATAGDGQYSVSELQVFTPQANTAGTYATFQDGQGFAWSDGRANDGQNFLCNYDAPFGTALGVDNGVSVQPWSTAQPLRILFFVDSVSLNVHCTDGNDYNIAAAHNRECSMGLVPPSSYAGPFTDQFQAGFCAPPSPGAPGSALLSYMNFDNGTDPSVSNSAIQFESLDNVIPPTSVSDLQCTDFDSLDAHIPDVLRGVVPRVAAAATRQTLNLVLDYHNSGMQHLLRFPPAASPGCPVPSLGEPPAAEADNIGQLAGQATGVGDDRSSATLRISGRFTVEHAVALDQAALTVHSLLHELGVGDAVRAPGGDSLFPLSLQPQNGSKPDKGQYRTPSGPGPNVSARVAPAKGSAGSMDFEIEVKSATIIEPAACGEGATTAPLMTSFLLVGGSEEPVWVHATANWACDGSHLRTP